MGFLKSLPTHIPDRVLWCVYSPDAKARKFLNRVPPDVRDYVRSRHGRFVPIQGFDELMAKLLSKLRERGSVPDLYERLCERARQRERSYDDQQRRLFEAAVASDHRDNGRDKSSSRTSGDLALSEAVSEIAESRKDKPCWVWFKEAEAAGDLNSQEAVLLQGIDALPNSAPMLRTYASFLARERSDLDKAEAFYKRALTIDPKEPLTLGFYADFLTMYRDASDAADEHYQRSLEVRPDDAYVLTKYALFLQRVRGDFNKAEELFLRALDIRPDYVFLLKSYAEFLRSVRGNSVKADELERRAQSLEENEPMAEET
jgi:Tfp pilus assembly protein PilF